MKRSTFVLCLALCFMFSLTCSAQNTEKVTIQTGWGSGIFKLLYAGKAPGTVKVSILNSKEEVIFTETLTKVSSFARPYNFNELGTGDFSMVVEDKEGKIKKPISFKIKKVESDIDVSKIANSVNKYLLSVENKDSDNIKVTISDNEGRVLHEESITVSGKFSIIYNLNKIKTSVLFEITGSNGVLKTFRF